MDRSALALQRVAHRQVTGQAVPVCHAGTVSGTIQPESVA